MEIWFFYMNGHGWEHWPTVPKTTFQEKNSNFCYKHSFFMNFLFVWKMSIAGTYCEHNFASGVARRPGTRSKMKWQWYILTMLLCFSHQMSKTLYNSRYHLKTSLGCVSIQQKKFCGKIFIFQRDMIFLLDGHGWDYWTTVIQAKIETQNHVSGEKF